MDAATLVRPEPQSPEVERLGRRAPDPARLTLALIVGATLVRLAYLLFLSPLDLAPDEAHYWDWSRHLDWSYYSKGPLVAWLIRLSCDLFGPLALSLNGTLMPAVRLPAVLCGAFMLLGLYRLTAASFGKPWLGLGVVVVALSLPLFSAGATLMTIDAPLACAWVWALVFSRQALLEGRTRSWVAAGACIAVGVLAKHTMVLFVPSLGLFLLLTPRFRSHLLRPGFWAMALIGALGGLPILFWNMANGWVTLKHTQGHAGLDGGGLRPLGPFVYLGTQAALLLGFWFVVYLRGLWAYRPWKETDQDTAFLWWMSVPVFAFFLLFSLKNGGGEPNWPIVAYLSGMILAAAWLARRLGWAGFPRAESPRFDLARPLAYGFLVLGFLVTLAVHDSRWLQPVLVRLAGSATEVQPAPLRRLDPTCRLKGWRTLAGEVDALAARLRAEGSEPLIAAGSWSLPGEIGFYSEGHPTVYSLGSGLGDRRSQYDLWHPNPVDDPEDFAGRTFILVGIAPYTVRNAFDQVEPLRWVRHEENGHPIAVWGITVGRGFRGLPHRPTTSGY